VADEWRRVVATLADATRRRAYASIVLDDSAAFEAIGALPGKRREKAITALLAAGLIHQAPDCATGFATTDAVFSELLASAPAVTRTGIDRFIRDGRIEQYPSRPDDRDAVLRWARDHAISRGEVVSERDFTERLSGMVRDAVALRRYLVDAGLVARDADGRRYRFAG
jgi:hypothetical protein